MDTAYKNIRKVWYIIEENFLILLIMTMGIDILIQIVSRRIFNYPISYTEELARHIQVWVTFLGIGLCLRRGEMIRATFVYDKLPKIFQYMMDFISHIFMFWVTYTIILPSWMLTKAQNKIAWDTIQNLNLGLKYVCVPIGFIIVGFYLIGMLVQTLKEIYFYFTMKGKL